MVKIYLPYYLVEILPGNRRFYGEAYISLRVPRFLVFVLATPRDLGFEKIPLGARQVEPLVSPSEYARILEETLEEASKRYGEPSFDFGGWKGLLRSFLGGRRGPKPVNVNARLALSYSREVLGITPGSRLRAYPEKYWLPVEIDLSRRRITAYITRGTSKNKFTVLERLASTSQEAYLALKELVKDAGEKPL